MLKKIVILLAIFFASVQSNAQKEGVTSALERLVTVTLSNEQAELLIKQLEFQANISFSYAPKVMQNRPLITISSNKQTVRFVLATAFGETIRIKEKGRYVILIDNRIAYSKPFGEKLQVIEGYVTDSHTGEKIINATVFDKQLLVSAVTNEYGYFKMELPSGVQSSSIKISKSGYSDTTFTSSNKRGGILDLRLPSIWRSSNSTDSTKKRNGILSIRFPKWLISDKQRINSINVGDTIYRKIQVSLVPYVGTNRQLSGNVINNVSLNIIGGYSQGVRYVEVGGMVNIIRGDASYVMVSSANYVGGDMVGTQLGGVFNRTQKMKGVQIAGVTNHIVDSLIGVQLTGVAGFSQKALNGTQISGVLSETSRLKGCQLSGVISFANTATGVQVAGVSSVARMGTLTTQVAGAVAYTNGNIAGTQTAGAVSVARNLKGAQIAGAIATAKVVEGVQIAGIANIADTVRGSQVAGVLNKGRVVKGVQVGLINIDDTTNGVPIGFLTYVKKGYHQLELSTDELIYVNVAFRTGTKRFFNILSAGIRPEPGKTIYQLGYGLGTSFRLNSKAYLDVDLSSHTLLSSKSSWSDNNQLYKGYIGIDRKIGKGCSISLGTTFNLFSYASMSTNMKDALLYTMWEKRTDDNRTFCGWMGFKAGIRF